MANASKKIKTDLEQHDAPVKTINISTIDPKYKRKNDTKECKSSIQNITNSNKERIPLHQKNSNKLSIQQRQENLQNLHHKTKLLLKNNLERKKTLNCKTNETEPKNIFNVKKEAPNIFADKNKKQKNNFSQNARSVNNRIVKKKNVSKIQKEKISCVKKSQTPFKNTTDEIINTENINANTQDIHFSQKLFDYPYNFISAVKNKLSMTVNSPRRKNNKLVSTPLSKPASKLVQNVDYLKNQESSAKDNGISQVSNVISDLKSSLSEIQNLTLSISFHDIRTCQCPAKPTNNVEIHKEGDKNETNLINSIIKDNNNPIPELTPPNCVLTPPKTHIDRAMSKSLTKQEKNNFHKELNLLDSFNESLNHLQKVDEALSSIRMFSEKDVANEEKNCLQFLQSTSTSVNFQGCSTYAKLKSEFFNSKLINSTSSRQLDGKKKDPPKYKPPELEQKHSNIDLALSINPQTFSETANTNEQAESFVDFITNSSENSFLSKKNNMESFLEGYQWKKSNSWKSNNKSFVGHLCQFCICLISQNIEDEKSRLGYLTTFLKVRERTLVDAARTELLCLEVQKKQYHDQIPLLKKKQRGLLLKLQQERYEIKHIKKFHLAKSQERKEALKRQLKHLKILLLVDAYNSSRKNSQLKKSVLSITRPSSPVRGINISDESEALKDRITEKRDTLVEQKKKLNDLLIHYYNLQIDNLEIDALEKRVEIEKKLLQNKIDSLGKDIQKPENVNDDNMNTESLPIANIDNNDNVKNMETTSSVVCEDKNLHEVKDTNENIVSENVLLDNSKEYYSLSGLKLNELWRKITGNDKKKYDDIINYNMSEADLEKFFNNAKEIAYKNLIESLGNTPIEDQEEISKNSKSVFTVLKPTPSEIKTEYTNESDSSDSTARSLIEELENFPNDLSHSTEGTSEISKTEISIPNTKENLCCTSEKCIEQNIPNEENITKHSEDSICTTLPIDSKTKESNTGNEKKTYKMNERQKLLSSPNFAKFDSFIQEREAMHQQESLNIARWEAMSPSPELSPHDSPTGEYSPAFAAVALSRLDEAEELRKKQLAIEREIKALQRQQSQIPYCIVREIPDKPPPPYIPPTEESKTVTSPSQTTKESISLKPADQVINTISTMCEFICSQLKDSSENNTRDYHSFLKHISKKSKQMPAVHSMFLFDLCNETFEAEYKAWHATATEPWEYQEKIPLASHYNSDLCKVVEGKIRKILSIDSPKESALVKTEDHVEKLLIKELYEEEIHWGNVEKYEIAVKNEITNSILQSLIKEAVNEYKATHSEINNKETD